MGNKQSQMQQTVKDEEDKNRRETVKEIEIKGKNVQDKNIVRFPLCEICVRQKSFEDRVAVFMCFQCELYVCENCTVKHKLHKGVTMGSEGMVEKIVTKMGRKSKKRRTAEKLWDEIWNEKDRNERIMNSKVVIGDRVQVKHTLDKKDCYVTGLCGLDDKRWVVCDCDNYCIKIVKLGCNQLQLYVLLESRPWGVTEIQVNKNSAAPHLLSGSGSDISITDPNVTEKQHLIAVTLPWERQIIFLDISQNLASTRKVIKTEEQCFYLEFYKDQIFTLCREDPNWCLYIKSIDGKTLKKYNTAMQSSLFVPRLVIVLERVYLTDWDKNKLQCRNVEGKVFSEMQIDGSWPRGISVDPDNNIYICACDHHNIYKLDSDLTEYIPLLDRTVDYLEGPRALCYYKDKLYIGHGTNTPLQNFVTVVYLL